MPPGGPIEIAGQIAERAQELIGAAGGVRGRQARQRNHGHPGWSHGERIAPETAYVDDQNRSFGGGTGQLGERRDTEEMRETGSFSHLEHDFVPLAGKAHALVDSAIGSNGRASGMSDRQFILTGSGVKRSADRVEATREIREGPAQVIELAAELQLLRPQDGAALLEEFDRALRVPGGDGAGRRVRR